jgi:hypothetical protein
MILVAFILFAALILAWLASPGDVKEKRTESVASLEPMASPAD